MGDGQRHAGSGQGRDEPGPQGVEVGHLAAAVFVPQEVRRLTLLPIFVRRPVEPRGFCVFQVSPENAGGLVALGHAVEQWLAQITGACVFFEHQRQVGRQFEDVFAAPLRTGRP
ncbi:MAG: hypothetical protein R3C10_03955 [Pirellulales bacterium]